MRSDFAVAGSAASAKPIRGETPADRRLSRPSATEVLYQSRIGCAERARTSSSPAARNGPNGMWCLRPAAFDRDQHAHRPPRRTGSPANRPPATSPQPSQPRESPRRNERRTSPKPMPRGETMWIDEEERRTRRRRPTRRAAERTPVVLEQPTPPRAARSSRRRAGTRCGSAGCSARGRSPTSAMRPRREHEIRGQRPRVAEAGADRGEQHAGEQLDERVARTRSASPQLPALARAAAATRRPGCCRGRDRRVAARAVRRRLDDRLLARNAPDDDVQERTDDQSVDAADRGDQRGHDSRG